MRVSLLLMEKFQLGLFETPYVKDDKAEQIVELVINNSDWY